MKPKMIEDVCLRMRIPLSSGKLEKLSAFSEQLLEWSKRFNLISKKDTNPEGITKHILDSLSALNFLSIPLNSEIIDIGSGAGFPAIPLKIVREDVDFTLIESIRKKFLFLKDVARKLNLSKFSIFNQRAEELSCSDKFKNRYDFATIKALTNLNRTVKLCFPFLKINGVLISYKGEKSEEELKQLKQNVKQEAFSIIKKESIQIPEVNLKRNLVAIEKRLDF